MLRRLFLGLVTASLVLAMSATAALAGNPSGSGQPNAGCGDQNAIVQPSGFTNNVGFPAAALVYAGSDNTPSLNANSGAAVSQYDVACYQLTQH